MRKKVFRKFSTVLVLSFILGLFYGEEALAKAKYTVIGEFHEGMARVGSGTTKEDMKYGYINEKGKEVIPLGKYDYYLDGWGYYSDYSEGLLAVRKDGKTGFVDRSGNLVIPLQYDEVYPFFEGFATVRKGDYWGLIDKTGREIVKPKYVDSIFFYDGYETVRKKVGEAEGIINTKGEEIISPGKYSEIELSRKGSFSETKIIWRDGFVKVAVGEDENKKWGLVNEKGEEIAKPVYDSVEFFSDGLAALYKNGKSIFINKQGKTVLTSKHYVMPFSEGLAVVRMENERGKIKYGFMNKKGKIVIKPKYDYVESFQNGLALVYKGPDYSNDKCGLINKKGKEILPVKYEEIKFLFGDLLAVKVGDKQGEKWGIATKKGKEIVKPIYDYIDSVDKKLGLILARKDNKTVCLNKKGKEVFHLLNLDFTYFNEGVILGKKDGKWSFFPHKGKKVTKSGTYDEIFGYQEGFSGMSKGEKRGFVTDKGKEVIEVGKYDGFGSYSREGLDFYFKNGYLLVIKGPYGNEKWGIVDKNGKEILSPQYDRVNYFSEGIAAVKKGDVWLLVNEKGEELVRIE